MSVGALIDKNNNGFKSMQDMASSLRNSNVLSLANRVAQNANAYPNLTADHYSQLRQQELVMELTQKLQTSLEIEDIINMLLLQMRKLVPIDGITYEYTPLAYNFASPMQGRHTASYQLDLGKEDLGMISFSRRIRFEQEELLSIENLMSCLLYPLRNGLKYHEAVIAASTDQLTGTGNRQALDKALTHEINLAQRNDTPLSVVMFDFDHFKKLNDGYGHQFGDQVLKEIIQEVKQTIRKTDLLFRYGGEEFMLLLHKTSLTNAAAVADKIRERIASKAISLDQKSIKVSVSMGAATLHEGDITSTLIKRADDALYHAKDLGRNRVCTEFHG